MDESDLSQFLTYLAVGKNVAASTQNQALSAILCSKQGGGQSGTHLILSEGLFDQGLLLYGVVWMITLLKSDKG